MSKIEELIAKYCPDGVEWKALGDITLMKRGTSATKGIMQEGNIPVISGGRQPAFYCNQSNRQGETITNAGSGAGAGYVQYWNNRFLYVMPSQYRELIQLKQSIFTLNSATL